LCGQDGKDLESPDRIAALSEAFQKAYDSAETQALATDIAVFWKNAASRALMPKESVNELLSTVIRQGMKLDLLEALTRNEQDETDNFAHTMLRRLIWGTKDSDDAPALSSSVDTSLDWEEDTGADEA